MIRTLVVTHKIYKFHMIGSFKAKRNAADDEIHDLDFVKDSNLKG